MDILYADEKIAVCVKEAGVLSTDEPGGMPSLLREALHTGTIYTVHRLDAAVGGVMVYARTRHAASDLGKAIQRGELTKEYRAVLRGSLPEKRGTLHDWLLRDTRQGVTRTVTPPCPGAQEAALDYEILAEREGLSLVKIRLLTGRTHQIRCQFAARGCPLWGDRKYGTPEAETVALWARSLIFPHPKSGETLCFAAPTPARAPWTVFNGDME